jgi:hypothetical protein
VRRRANGWQIRKIILERIGFQVWKNNKRATTPMILSKMEREETNRQSRFLLTLPTTVLAFW